MTARPPDKRPSFEKALERLETLVADMEGGQLSLDKMMAHFEEGMDLVRFCSGKLNEVERRIEILVKKGDDVVAEPFEPGADAGAPEPPGRAGPARETGDDPDR